jgi:hypothetical protein
MRTITIVLVNTFLASILSACTLETDQGDDPGTEIGTEGILEEIGSDDAAVEVQPARHCVSEALPAGSKEDPLSPVCFGTFAEAIAHATAGVVQLPGDATEVTQEELDASYAQAAAGDIRLAAVVIGISYWDDNYHDGSWTHTASAGCDNDSDFEYWIINVGSSWNDEISSARGFSLCQGIYYENANFGGAQIGTDWSGGAMNDKTTSIRWR